MYEAINIMIYACAQVIILPLNGTFDCCSLCGKYFGRLPKYLDNKITALRFHQIAMEINDCSVM
jgi:hypothetical protein